MLIAEKIAAQLSCNKVLDVVASRITDHEKESTIQNIKPNFGLSKVLSTNETFG